MADPAALSADQLAEKVLLLLAFLADPRTPSEADRAYREAAPLIAELVRRASELEAETEFRIRVQAERDQAVRERDEAQKALADLAADASEAATASARRWHENRRLRDALEPFIRTGNFKWEVKGQVVCTLTREEWERARSALAAGGGKTTTQRCDHAYCCRGCNEGRCCHNPANLAARVSHGKENE